MSSVSGCERSWGFENSSKEKIVRRQFVFREREIIRGGDLSMIGR